VGASGWAVRSGRSEGVELLACVTQECFEFRCQPSGGSESVFVFLAHRLLDARSEALQDAKSVITAAFCDLVDHPVQDRPLRQEGSHTLLLRSGTTAHLLDERCEVDPKLLEDLGGKPLRHLGKTQQFMLRADVTLVEPAGLDHSQLEGFLGVRSVRRRRVGQGAVGGGGGQVDRWRTSRPVAVVVG